MKAESPNGMLRVKTVSDDQIAPGDRALKWPARALFVLGFVAFAACRPADMPSRLATVDQPQPEKAPERLESPTIDQSTSGNAASTTDRTDRTDSTDTTEDGGSIELDGSESFNYADRDGGAADSGATRRYRSASISCSSNSQNQVHRAYIGYYGRCADRSGFEYWCKKLDTSGGSLDAIITKFGTSTEYTQRFGRLSDASLIKNLYKNLFNRGTDTEGQKYYEKLLNQRRSSWARSHGGSKKGATEFALSRIALDVLNGAQGDDKVILQKKVNDCAKKINTAAPANPTASQTPTGKDKYTIYISTTGNNKNSGTSKSPLATLAGAYAKMKTAWRKSPGNTTIYVKPGRYRRQTVRWGVFDSRYYIRIFGMGSNPTKTIFDGETQVDALFDLVAYGRSNVHLKNFTLMNYREGISFFGAKRSNDPKKVNSHNTVEKIYFQRIGNSYFKDNSKSFAVLRLQTSSHNTVKGCKFVDNKSNPHGDLLHSIYLAHRASNNKIHNNEFRNVSGDTVRIRDYSNQNDVAYNSFANIKGYAVSAWFDSTDSVDTECPSLNNSVRRNTLKDTGLFSILSKITDIRHCKVPSSTFTGRKQITTSGNK